MVFFERKNGLTTLFQERRPEEKNDVYAHLIISFLLSRQYTIVLLCKCNTELYEEVQKGFAMLVNQGRRRQRLVSSIGICIVLMVLSLLSVAAPFTTGSARAASSATTPTPTPTPARPVASFTSPAPFATFTAGAPIQIAVAASISSGNITHVDFQAEPNSGTNPFISLGTDTSAPYSITWNNAPTGVFVLNALVYSDGPYSTEISERIAITPDGRSPFPMVNITSPSNGAQFVSPATIQVNASVTIGSGTITRIDFQAQGNNISYQGTATSAPYSVTFSNIFPGTYTINAVAYANTSVGVVGNTVSIQVIVNNGPPPGGCFVKYTVTQFTGGFLANLNIINASSTTINGWKLVFTFPGTQQVLYGFNGIFTQVGNQVTIANASWNGTIASNGIVNTGFNGSWSGSNPSPTNFTLNGVSCRAI
jgi:hypothetical protein